MPIQKQPLTFNFSQGLDLKTDPKQVAAGKFLSLENMVFNKGGLLQKRNGFSQLTNLPNIEATYLTTFNGNLTAIADEILAYSPSTNQWIQKGNIQPLSVNTLPLIRSNTNQSQADIAISGNGLICTVYTDQNTSSLTEKVYKYVVANATTGQNIIEPTLIPAVSGGTVVGSPRVFNLGSWFIILFTNEISATFHLQYIAINTSDTTLVTVPVDIVNSYNPSPALSYDAVVLSNGTVNNLYIVYDTSSGGQAVQARYLTSALTLSSLLTYSGFKSTNMSVCLDALTSNIHAAFYDSVSSTGYTLAFNEALQTILAPVEIITATTVLNITSAAQSGLCTAYYEVANDYGYDSSLATHFIQAVSVPDSTGVPSSATTVIRSLGLASKAFVVNGTEYFLGSYDSALQSTYFVVNGTVSLETSPVIVAKTAYSNGVGYLTDGLPNAIVNDSSVSIPYLFADSITAVNKGTNLPAGTQIDGIYSQFGINYVSFTFSSKEFDTVEIGSALQLSGGFLWMYDGYLPVEQNFFLYPDNVEAAPLNSGGSMPSQQYFYQAVYEWADNQGNIHQSASSVPLLVDMSTSNPAFVQPTPVTPLGGFVAGSTTISVDDTTGLAVGQFVTDTTNPSFIQAGTFITSVTAPNTITVSLPVTTTSGPDTLSISSINSATINVPTLRLTYKTANPVKISIYRWSTAQQNYYQITSITQPLLNDTTIDSVSFTDTFADNQILGNRLIYTTGGVVEDVNAPANNIMTLWNTRLFLVDAEDQNLIWFSKQVIEGTPVEMSDLFTIFVAPTIGASGSTGPITALGAMDVYLLVFKKDALYYISGTGPDNTGANNGFTDPVFITSVVGCTNQQSIINIPTGVMFQSDKGIWLLDRGLGTTYIGAPVEDLVLGSNVVSAKLIPGTNQVRFTMDSGITLMYDYYYNQWGTFNGIPGVSSCIYNSLHTFLDSFGRVFQESEGQYLDGTSPVLIQFTTSWLNLAGLDGYERIYEFGLLGSFISPHTLNVLVAYDFQNPTQQSTIVPQNYTGVYGSDSLYGQTTPFGGPSTLEQWRVHTKKQKCQTFQLSINEVFNSQYGTVAGAGLTLSAINCVVGVKKGYRPYKGANSVG